MIATKVVKTAMGGAGPYIEVSTSHRDVYWHTKLPDLPLEELEGIWKRAQGFIDEFIILPLIQAGWKEGKGDEPDKVSLNLVD